MSFFHSLNLYRVILKSRNLGNLISKPGSTCLSLANKITLPGSFCFCKFRKFSCKPVVGRKLAVTGRNSRPQPGLFSRWGSRLGHYSLSCKISSSFFFSPLLLLLGSLHFPSGFSTLIHYPSNQK